MSSARYNKFFNCPLAMPFYEPSSSRRPRATEIKGQINQIKMHQSTLAELTEKMLGDCVRMNAKAEESIESIVKPCLSLLEEAKQVYGEDCCDEVLSSAYSATTASTSAGNLKLQLVQLSHVVNSIIADLESGMRVTLDLAIVASEDPELHALEKFAKASQCNQVADQIVRDFHGIMQEKKETLIAVENELAMHIQVVGASSRLLAQYLRETKQVSFLRLM